MSLPRTCSSSHSNQFWSFDWGVLGLVRSNQGRPRRYSPFQLIDNVLLKCQIFWTKLLGIFFYLWKSLMSIIEMILIWSKLLCQVGFSSIFFDIKCMKTWAQRLGGLASHATFNIIFSCFIIDRYQTLIQQSVQKINNKNKIYWIEKITHHLWTDYTGRHRKVGPDIEALLPPPLGHRNNPCQLNLLSYYLSP